MADAAPTTSCAALRLATDFAVAIRRHDRLDAEVRRLRPEFQQPLFEEIELLSDLTGAVGRQLSLVRAQTPDGGLAQMLHLYSLVSDLAGMASQEMKRSAETLQDEAARLMWSIRRVLEPLSTATAEDFAGEGLMPERRDVLGRLDLEGSL